MKVTKKDREQMCHDLLSARGWISCWFPLGMEDLPDDCKLNGILAGPLKSAMMKIDEVLEQLGHTHNGLVKP